MKEYRARLGLTQEKLAETVGVRRETIIFLEQGKYNPSLKLAWNISRALGAGIEDVFIFDEE
jgi:putative transcriptional regulator